MQECVQGHRIGIDIQCGIFNWVENILFEITYIAKTFEPVRAARFLELVFTDEAAGAGAGAAAAAGASGAGSAAAVFSDTFLLFFFFSLTSSDCSFLFLNFGKRIIL